MTAVLVKLYLVPLLHTASGTVQMCTCVSHRRMEMLWLKKPPFLQSQIMMSLYSVTRSCSLAALHSHWAAMPGHDGKKQAITRPCSLHPVTRLCLALGFLRKHFAAERSLENRLSVNGSSSAASSRNQTETAHFKRRAEGMHAWFATMQ